VAQFKLHYYRRSLTFAFLSPIVSARSFYLSMFGASARQNAHSSLEPGSAERSVCFVCRFALEKHCWECLPHLSSKRDRRLIPALIPEGSRTLTTAIPRYWDFRTCNPNILGFENEKYGSRGSEVVCPQDFAQKEGGGVRQGQQNSRSSLKFRCSLLQGKGG
jgi:hypothetical protein